MASRISTFLSELKRRKVYRVAAVYVVVGLGTVAAADSILPPLGLERAQSLVVVLVLLGLPIALSLAWAYELRPEEPVASEPSAEGAPSTPEAIVVLPFDNMSPDPDDAFFAEGLTEEIITNLSRIRALRVISRNSAMVLKGTQKDTRTIARELDVQYVLEGSVRKAGNDLRITAQLIGAERDEHLWADTYDRSFSLQDLFVVQTEIAKQVEGELRATITPEETRRLASQPTENLEAYEEYLKGRHHARRYTLDGFTKGIEHFEKAIGLDEEFAPAYVGLGYCSNELSYLSYLDPAEGYPKAKAALQRAIDLDDSLGEAHATLASLRFKEEWDLSGPEAGFLRAVELSPDSPEVFIAYGTYLMWTGQAEKSITMLQRAVQLDPLMPIARGWLAAAYFYANRYDESIQQHERILELDPRFIWSHVYLSHNHSLKGDHFEAVAHADTLEAITEDTDDSYLMSYVGGSYAWAGEEAKAREILVRAEELHSGGTLDAITVAVIYGMLGEADKAFEWLNRGVDERAGLALLLKVYGGTFLRDLRPDPRYDEVLKRVGFDV